MSNRKVFAPSAFGETLRALPAPPPEPAEAATIDPRQLYEVCPMCSGTRLLPIAFKKPPGTLCVGCRGLRFTPVGITIKQFGRIMDGARERAELDGGVVIPEPGDNLPGTPPGTRGTERTPFNVAEKLTADDLAEKSITRAPIRAESDK